MTIPLKFELGKVLTTAQVTKKSHFLIYWK